MRIAAVLGISSTAGGMCAAGIALLAAGAWVARVEVRGARGPGKVVALGDTFFAAPLAIFGALHLLGPTFVAGMVPRYMPWRMFWVYGVGCALVAAALSIATRIGVRWSALLVGVMMFLFVGMLYLPAALRHPADRLARTISFREASFGGAAWLIAAGAGRSWPDRTRSALGLVGRLAIAAAAIVFGVEHFLHPTGLPGVPLQKQLPAWIPWRELIDYATGAALLVAGGSGLLGWRTRAVAAWVGTWIVLLVVAVYGPVLLGALSSPATATQVEGVNYFADTLLFAGTILALARPARGTVAP